jgi:hypothetical protein
MQRSDRRKLEYHRVVVDHLNRDEARVRRIGLENVAKIRSLYLAPNRANEWIDEWEELLCGPREALATACLEPGEHGNDMRQMTPFAGVITQDERMIAVARARECSEWCDVFTLPKPRSSNENTLMHRWCSRVTPLVLLWVYAYFEGTRTRDHHG